MDVIKVSKIINKGWPVFKKGKVSKKWKKAHAEANKAARKKHGAKIAKEVTKLVRKTPKDELLGTHTRKGTIIISKIVPKKLVPAIITHEKVEHQLMTQKKKKYIYNK